jgi:hypothetical protein
MKTQKTWTDLLGNVTNNDAVDGRNIIRVTGKVSRRVLWTFDNHAQACACFNQWVAESNSICTK